MNKDKVDKIKKYIVIVMLLLLIVQIISFFIGSTKVTVFLMTLIVLGNVIVTNIDKLIISNKVDKIKKYIVIMMLLLFIIQIISFFIGSTKVTVFLMTLIVLGNVIVMNIDKLIISKSETTDEEK